MKTVTCLAAAAALLVGATVVHAQTMGTSPEKSKPSTERSHKGKSGGGTDSPTARGNGGGGTTGQAAPRGSSRPTGAAPAPAPMAPSGGGTRAPQGED